MCYAGRERVKFSNYISRPSGFIQNSFTIVSFSQNLNIRQYKRVLYPLISEALPRYYNQGITKESPIIAM
ncbi:hypothetical protein HanXRQr2_Chr09g0365961 [Helianthus annuus]|uniref:Uncharacterized protein n=1 Tax=Helianthus annuus TaxID=4232 RepID=A0A9K3N6W8_HELAN|nr:hypothetical protein HanXRQr2_Chr09g0365951 [Helianthus annuus]KAF5789020.1 hypothetical protein HanXRQr2_Chr09g0365961 [Helianthus annuus]KAJ0532217.1 hypothetical protein HanIR_Chr09g0394251 [Helianthus annuus]KAJ0532218.1 hypothetical protein HanIR_Chr09g0394261 [Helianthus annuus]KAJ0891347.1 hypothetical protein HanPSC8_Chr09g0352641 [Helianthus annuus]